MDLDDQLNYLKVDIKFNLYQHHHQFNLKLKIKIKKVEAIKNLNYLNEEKPYLEHQLKVEPFNYQNHPLK